MKKHIQNRHLVITDTLTYKKCMEQSIKERIVNVLISAKEFDLLLAWNYYCEFTDNDGDYIYDMQMLDDYFNCIKPSKLLWYAQQNDFRINEPYFKFDGNDLETTDFVKDLIEIDDLADYILNDKDCCGFSELNILLEEKC